MKRLLLILLLLLPALSYAQTAPTPDTTHFRSLGFHGNVNLNYNYASPGNAGYNGVGANVILGSRFTQWYLLGGGVGFHSLLNLGHEDYNLFATIYLQNSFYIQSKPRSILCSTWLSVAISVGLASIKTTSHLL